MRQKIKFVMPVLIGIFMLFVCPMTTHAAGTGSVSMSVSSQEVNIGDTVTVSVQALGPSGEAAVAVMNISFDSNVFQFVSCSDSTYGGGGSNISVATDSATVTLKAVAEGKSNISVSAYNGVIFNSNEDIDSMSGNSTSVTVSNAVSAEVAEAENKSDDNSLSSLSLSEGTLSPAFKGNTTKYTATVPNDVTEVKVSAKTANDKAEITSVTGNTNLKVGTNNISIVVKAENGTTATYTIALTRSEQTETTVEKETEKETEKSDNSSDAVEIMVNDKNYTISEEFSDEEIPEGFSKAEVTYQGVQFQGVKFDQGELYLLYMISAEGEGKFFVLDGARNILYPFIQMHCGEHYIILLMPVSDLEVPKGYTETVLVTPEQEQISAFVSEENPEYNLVYAMNKEGASEWYQYDTIEGTYQRFQGISEMTEETEEDALSDYNDLYKQYAKLKNKNQAVLVIMILCLFALFVSIVMLLAGKKRRVSSHEEDDMLDEDYEDDVEALDESEDLDEIYDDVEDESEETYDEEEKYEDLTEDGVDDESEESYDEEEMYEDLDEAYDEEEIYEEEYDAPDVDTEDVELEEEKKSVKKKKKEKSRKVHRGRNAGKEKTDDELEVIDLNDL